MCSLEPQHAQIADQLAAVGTSRGSLERVDRSTFPFGRDGGAFRRQVVHIILLGDGDQTSVALGGTVGEVLTAGVARLHRVILPRVSLQ